MSTARGAGSRWSSPGAALCALAVCAALATGCGNKDREAQLLRLESKVAKERAEAVRALAALARPGDDELWAALERSSRDTSLQVKLAVVEALGDAPPASHTSGADRGSLADDALSVLLGDADDHLRAAAARALGKRCGPRPIAYLQGAFNRGGIAARAAVSAALLGCGVRPETLFARAEEARRTRALERLERSNSAQRAWAAGELGLLGREQDVALLEGLLDDEDGAVVAAAALGLGRAGAQKAAGRLGLLAGDEVPVIAAAAARALAELGPEACRGAAAALEQQAALAGDQAVPAAAARALAVPEAGASLCALAVRAAEPRAAALLARGCPPGPLGDALAKVVPAKGPLTLEAASQAAALLEALLQARAEPLGAAAAVALGRLASAGAAGLSERAAEAVGLLDARRAAPALLALVRAQRAARQKELAAQTVAAAAAAAAPKIPPLQPQAGAADQGGAAAELQAEKYARLMKLIGDRSNEQALREGATERLAALLRGEPAPARARELLVQALRSLLALGVKEAKREAALLAEDPDPALAAAAQATPRVADPPASAAPALPAQPPVEAARRELWSAAGAERAAACTLLASLSDAASAPLRAALSADPERRVRAACAANKETAPAGAR